MRCSLYKIAQVQRSGLQGFAMNLQSAYRRSLHFLGPERSQRGVKILIVQNYLEQRAVDMQTAVATDKAQFPDRFMKKLAGQ
jgi:hypothetical protein